MSPLSKAAQAKLDDARKTTAAAKKAAATRGTKPVKASAKKLADAIKGRPQLPNPLDEAPPVTGNEQTDQLNEMAALDKALSDPTGFRARALREENRYALATETTHYVTVGFLSRADKELFLQRVGLVPAEIYGNLFLDGYQVAAQIGIDMSE
jgi:type II secretory pathway component HofQ